jgi:uncharacterized protein YkwD
VTCLDADGAGNIDEVHRILAVALLMCATAACGPPDRTGGPPDAPADAPSQEGAIVALINEHRAEAGCPAVTPDEHLATAARRHATDMRDRGVRDHPGSDDSTPQQRIADAGFTPTTATGEIIYWSEPTGDPRAAVAGWMNSPAHRDVIRTCRFTHAGAGVVTGPGFAAVVDFGAH